VLLYAIDRAFRGPRETLSFLIASRPQWNSQWGRRATSCCCRFAGPAVLGLEPLEAAAGLSSAPLDRDCWANS